MGIIRRPWLSRASDGNLARTPGLHPYSLREVPWDFLMTTESQDLGFNVSTERRYNTLPVSLLRHKFVTSLQPNHWRYQKSLCNLTSSESWDHADQLWWWSDEDSRTSTWNCTECVFQTIQHGGLSCWAEQIDCQHESCLADEIYRCMNFGDCWWNGVCHRAPYKRV